MNDYSGKLAAIALEAGTYEIYKFSGISKYSAFVSDDEFSIKFKVTEEKITYLGYAHFIVGNKDFHFGVSDMRERDLDLFRGKYPDLTGEFIVDLLKVVSYQST